MRKAIPFELNAVPSIEIDGALVANAFGIDATYFRQLLETRKIDTLCERGIDEDAGLFRASFYHQNTRVRLVVNRAGQLQGDIETRRR